MNPNDRNRRPPGSKKPAMPGIKKNMDEDEEEVTRRVGGARPNFRPNPGNMTFASPMMPAPMMNTAPAKAQASMQRQQRPKAVWGLSSVPTLPEFHPLERTAVFVANAAPEALASRIASVLRELSIEASYDNAKAKVRCVSQEGVDFRIRLYRGRGEFRYGIIVEVQRRFGGGLNFHNETKAILDAAEGRRPSLLTTTVSSRALPEVSDDEEDYVPPPSGASSLLMVSKMLQIPGFDGQYLGLQTLSTLVDAEKMSSQTARKVGAELLKVDSEVGRKVFSYIINRRLDDESYLELRALALSALANAMRATNMVPEFLRAQLRSVLLEDIKNAEKHPRIACYALSAMEYFIRGDKDAMELNDVFSFALATGEARHNQLMHQAQRCIAAIR
eukprot:scaffold953_cov141-Cylindrotheca_fusiformis.AAC.4